MIAFAANPLICRLALGQQLIDAASFTFVRVLAGALTLALIMRRRWRGRRRDSVNWWSVSMLFTYMIFFSFAYRSLSASTGTLLLFGAVQFTMFIVAMRDGERFNLLSWAGFSMAVIGLVYLVSPGITSPDPLSAILMIVAGVAWGGYSLLGRSAADPLESTAINFIYSVPLAAMVMLPFVESFHFTRAGLILAAASGAVASGLGYAAWYAALKTLTASRAATVQLSVPPIAAFGGVLFLSEPPSVRLVVASALTLGGIAIVLAQRPKPGSLPEHQA
ncbi:MAG: DMT family transporter [Planctomycetes bacterium]|nr:DMT family transporter [Planctomycetota bacterium]